MLNIINEHAPKKAKKIKVVPNAPWFDNEYASLKEIRNYNFMEAI